ncbi:MAG TPA: histidine phosphatase family protein [Candidatus Polarisedimenticolia bacterium]|nr:histidine phosphatase family protein [Candidatus Polarisedimenticolia bacterium]
MPSLYLLRHGIAAPHGADPGLSDTGRERMRRQGRGLARLGLRPDLILTSPLARAEETARVLSETLGLEEAVRVEEELSPGCAAAELISVLERHAAAGRLLAVGHQPDLGVLAGSLLGCRFAIPFDKGSLCGFETPSWAAMIAGHPARLVFFLPPDALVALGAD